MEEANSQPAAAQPEQRDVSRQTMIVLVILAIVVSLLGTFTVIKETTGTQKVVYTENSNHQPAQTGQGFVSLEIVDRSNLPVETAGRNAATGQVTLVVQY